MSNWAYLLRCANGTFYAGWTNDINKRLTAHNAGAGAKYTRAYRPVSIAFLRDFATKGEAMAYEARLKRLTHAKKAALAKEYAAGQAAAKDTSETSR